MYPQKFLKPKMFSVLGELRCRGMHNGSSYRSQLFMLFRFAVRNNTKGGGFKYADVLYLLGLVP